MAELLINVTTRGAEKIPALDKQLQKTEKSAKKLNKTTKDYAVILGATSAALAKFVKTGFDYNRQMEDSINGLASLNAATSSNIDSLGNHLTAQEKFTKAQEEAIVTMKELEKINAQTPHTLNQTNQIYKAMYTTMKNVGVSSKELVNITKQISIASGAAGIQFQQLLAGVDGLATGTVLANSELGRFLNSIGLTNAELKNTTDLVGLLQEKLGDFQTADTLTIAVSNLTNAFDVFAGAVTSNAFDNLKLSLNSMAEALQTVNEGFNRARIQSGSLYDLKGAEEYSQRVTYIGTQILEVTQRLENYSNFDRTFQRGKIEADKELLALLLAQEQEAYSLLEIERAKGVLVAKGTTDLKEQTELQDLMLLVAAKRYEQEAFITEEKKKQVSVTKELLRLQDIIGFNDLPTTPVSSASSGNTTVNNYNYGMGMGNGGYVKEYTAQEWRVRDRQIRAEEAKIGSSAGTGYGSSIGSGLGKDVTPFKVETDKIAKAFNQITVSLEEYEDALQTLKDATKIVASVMGDLQSIATALNKSLYDSAKTSIYGSASNGSVGFDKALSDTAKAIADINADMTNADLAKVYQEESAKLLQSLDFLNDTTQFASKQDQDFAKAKALYEIGKLDEARGEVADEADANLEALQAIKKALNGDSLSSDNLFEALKGAEGVQAKIEAGNIALGVTGANDTIKAYNKQTADGIGRYKVLNTYGEISTGGHTSITGITSATYTPYKDGGYTGNGGINDIAGVVHGKEYVLDANMTRMLENSTGGNTEQLLYEQLKITKKMFALEQKMFRLQKEVA